MFCGSAVPPAEARMLALCRPLLRFHIKNNCTFMWTLNIVLLVLLSMWICLAVQIFRPFLSVSYCVYYVYVIS